MRQKVRITRIRRTVRVTAASPGDAPCGRCGHVVGLLTPRAAADLLAITERRLEALAEAGSIHVIDTIAGPRICKASLFPSG